MDPETVRERRAAFAADARRRADRLYAFEIIAVASAGLDQAVRGPLADAMAGRPAYLAAIRALWDEEDLAPFAAVLNPIEKMIIIRAAQLRGDPMRVALLLPAPYDRWISSDGARTMPSEQVMNDVLDSLPDDRKNEVLAAMNFIRLQSLAIQRRLDELTNAIHRVALAGGADDTGLFETLHDLDETGAAAVRRLWDGERDETALLAAAGDNLTIHELIRRTLAMLRETDRR